MEISLGWTCELKSERVERHGVISRQFFSKQFNDFRFDGQDLSVGGNRNGGKQWCIWMKCEYYKGIVQASRGTEQSWDTDEGKKQGLYIEKKGRWTEKGWYGMATERTRENQNHEPKFLSSGRDMDLMYTVYTVTVFTQYMNMYTVCIKYTLS